MTKSFVLYDGRARLGDTDDAGIYVTASSEKEAREDGQNPAWQDGVWYEYDIVTTPETGERWIENGKPRWDLPPNK